MKRWLLLIVLLLLVPAFAFAKTEMENGVVTVTGEAELLAFIDWVHGYCISEPDKKPVYQTGLFHSLVIEGVKEIPENALSGFADLQMVRIADAVSIGGEAFERGFAIGTRLTAEAFLGECE